jgi:acyl-CoA synthetase (AMP-forming)/AMP-acid ligase II
MIVSGAENVFPAEVEEALADDSDILEAGGHRCARR